MSFNWSIIKNKLYGILKGSSKEVVMYDERGNRTIDPDEATRYFVTFRSDNKDVEEFILLISINDDGQDSVINIKTPELKSNEDFTTVYAIRDHIRNAIGRKEGIKVNWQVFDHEIDPREEAVNNIKESKDISKIFGSTKSSFQRIGEAKLIIRHTDTVNEEKHGARTRHIRALFVENQNGERFQYPHLHLSGARAFARHVSNGGSNHDVVANAIFEMSKDYISLRSTGQHLRKSNGLNEWVETIRENMQRINRTIKSLHGPKGYTNISPTLAQESIISDSQSVLDLQKKLAETCGLSEDDPMYESLGRAAHYIATYPAVPKPTFSWKSQPNLTAPEGMHENAIERLNWQLQELANYCSEETAASRLSGIANKISMGTMLEEDEMVFVRDAFQSSLSYIPEETRVLEEIELDEFLAEFDPDTLSIPPNDIITEDPIKEGDRYGQRVKIHSPNDTMGFHGKTGTISGKEGKHYRVKLDSPVDVPNVGKVHDDIWEPQHLKKVKESIAELEEATAMITCPNCKGSGAVKGGHAGQVKTCPVCNGCGDVTPDNKQVAEAEANDDSMNDDSSNDDGMNDDSSNDDLSETDNSDYLKRITNLAGI
jgi:hypothetical protein